MTPQNGSTLKQGNATEVERVQYNRLDGCGNRTKAECVFYSDGTTRFQHTDGWELNPWDFQPAPGEIEFVAALRSRSRNVPTNATVSQLDEDLAFEWLETPEILESTLQQVKQLILHKVTASGFGIIERNAECFALQNTGAELLIQYLELKKQIRRYTVHVQEAIADEFTFRLH